jgi:hypothetical protein
MCNALHGLYHKNRNGQFDDFHKSTKVDAEEEIRTGLGEIEISSNICVPPVFSTLKMII